MEDDVGAERERLLQVRGRERVVDDDEGADRMRRLGGRTDVDEVQERIRRRLEPDEARPLVEVLAEAARDLLRGEEREAVSLRLVHLREHPVDPAVHVVDADDVVAG